MTITATTASTTGSEPRIENAPASSPGVLLGRIIALGVADIRPPNAALVSTGADSCGTARRYRP